MARQVRALVRRLYHRLPLRVRRRLNRFRRAHIEPLHGMLPLPLPETIHIDPTNVCNFKCAFCPTADKDLLQSVGRPAGLMELDLFKKIVDDLEEMVRQYRRSVSLLHLYKDGEPLLNKKLPDMIAYAKKAKVAGVVSTTTNGALLTAEMASKLVDSGLDEIRVSVIHVTDSRYRELTQTFGNYRRIRDHVAGLYQQRNRRKSHLRIIVKTNDVGLSLEEKHQFEKDFTGIADFLMIDSMMGWSLSEVKDFTLGVAVETGMDSVSRLKEDRKVCPEPFSRLAVNFDGQVSVCCVDWSYGTIVGNLRKESLGDVWNGKRLREFRLAHLTGNRSQIPACANCQYVLGEPMGRDLDAHAERLVQIYRGA